MHTLYISIPAQLCMRMSNNLRDTVEAFLATKHQGMLLCVVVEALLQRLPICCCEKRLSYVLKIWVHKMAEYSFASAGLLIYVRMLFLLTSSPQLTQSTWFECQVKARVPGECFETPGMVILYHGYILLYLASSKLARHN